MKKDIKHFLFTAFIVVVGVILFDFFMGLILDKVMDKIPNFSGEGELVRDNYRLRKMREDIVILGSSRGLHHYVSQQLKDSINNYLNTNYSIYNASIDGKFANSNSCAAEVIINRYKPKLVIYDISDNFLETQKVSDIIFSSPFYWKDSIVHRYINDSGLKEKIIMQSSSYRYNDKIQKILFCFLFSVNIDDGYSPLYGTIIDTNKFVPSRTEQNTLNSYSVENFENVLKKYSEMKVPLIIVSSPQFRPTSINDDLSLICKKYNTPYIDIYNTDYFNNNPKLFKDETHLNDNGAHIYTAIFFDSLKTYLSRIL